MKKNIIFIGVLLLLMAGCGKSDYSQLFDAEQAIANQPTLHTTVEILGDDLDAKIEAKVDLENQLASLSMPHLTVYTDGKVGYAENEGNTYKFPLSPKLVEDYHLEGLVSKEHFKDYLPAADYQPSFEEVQTFANCRLNDVDYSDKTVEDIITSTGENEYTIDGQEDIVKLEFKDNTLTTTCKKNYATMVGSASTLAEPITLPDDSKAKEIKAKVAEDTYDLYGKKLALAAVGWLVNYRVINPEEFDQLTKDMKEMSR